MELVQEVHLGRVPLRIGVRVHQLVELPLQLEDFCIGTVDLEEGGLQMGICQEQQKIPPPNAGA